MKISSKSWKSYIDRLSKIDKKAADTIANFYRENPGISVEQLIGYCLSVADYYGAAAGELACEMYEEVAIASGKVIPTPEPARTATYSEMAATVRGTLLQSQNPDAIGAVVGRKVKTVSLDTILNNSLRDGAQFAWIPSGDTCAFCMMLASNGWQRASKKALKNGHASHVHNNCDCTYAVRFDDETEVEGYNDGEAYRAIYDLEGIDPKIIKKYKKEHGPIKTYKDRINVIRQAQYSADPEKYRVQKRINYAIREDKLETYRKEKNTGAFEDYDELMSKKHVRGILAELGIDSKGVKYKIERDEYLKGTGYFGHTSFDGKIITLYPDAFQNREQLVKTLGHEQIHLRQIQEHGIIKTHEELLLRENEAIASEKGWWELYVKKTGYRP